MCVSEEEVVGRRVGVGRSARQSVGGSSPQKVRTPHNDVGKNEDSRISTNLPKPSSLFRRNKGKPIQDGFLMKVIESWTLRLDFLSYM